MLRIFSVASDGATTAPNLETRFLVNFRKHTVANYASIWTLFSVFDRGGDVLCSTLNTLQFRR